MRVLITQGTLHRLSGSEVVTYELAEHFSSIGAEVSVASHGFNESWAERLTALDSVELFGVTQQTLRERFEQEPPDVAWIHHSVVPSWMLDSPATTTAFHHMSAFHPAEFPVSGRIEFALADTIAFPSQEALEFHSASPQFERADLRRLHVFGNPAPDRFYRQSPTPPQSLTTVLVVSNHVPDELRGAIALIRERGIVVRVFGEDAARGDSWTPVTQEDLIEADAVISIGKTVQYALVAGVPVFCYDYFGGPGWLSESNFDRARHFNFSGRGFDRMSADDLAAAVFSGFERAAQDAMTFHGAHGEQMLYSRAVPRALAPRDGAKLDPPGISDRADFLAAQDALALYMAGHAEISERLRALMQQLEEERMRSADLEEERSRLMLAEERRRGMGLAETLRDYQERRSSRR